jgi:hypothetical protein
LVEPAATNLVLRSEEFDNASWSKLNSSTITANTIVSPSGYQDADKFQASNLAFGGILRQSPTVTSGVAHTFSFFCKKDNHRYVGIRFNTSTVGGTIVPTYDFDTNTFNAQGVTGVTLSSQLYGNGWVRLILTFTSTSTTGLCDICIVPSDGDTATALTGTEAILVWGAQLEVGSYVSSYIPTLGSSVTRLADAASKTGISSLIGQSEGTLYAEFSVLDLDALSQYVGMTDGTFNNAVLLGKESGVSPNKLVFYIIANASTILLNTSVSLTPGFVKMAIAYKSGNYAAYCNGTLIESGTTSFTFSSNLDRLGYAGNGALSLLVEPMNVKSTAIYTTRLSNSQLASLTSL